MIETSGPVQCSEVKGMLHLDKPWWADTRIIGCAFVLESYGGEEPCRMTNEGRLHAAPGYLWDGTSRPIVRAQSDDDVAPSLVHDILYEALREGKLDPSDAHLFDNLYIEMLRERGMGRLVKPKKWYGWPLALVKSGWGKTKLVVRKSMLSAFGWTARRRNKGAEYPHRRAA